MAKVHKETIREKRYDFGYSQARLAELSGVSENVIKSIEIGRSGTSEEKLEKIAAALELTLLDIYDPHFRLTKVLVVGTNKGGAGKTSIATNTAYQLAKMGYKILIIDADLQMNCSDNFGFGEDSENSLYHAIVTETPLTHYIRNTKYDNLDIIISDFAMAKVDREIYTKNDRVGVVRNILQPVVESGKYDYIIIDSHTTLGDLNIAVYAASDAIIIPIEPSRFGVMGLHIISEFINSDIKGINPNFKILGIVFNRIDRRTTLGTLAPRELEEQLGGRLFETKLMSDANIANAQWVSTLAAEYDNTSKSVPVFEELCKEIVARMSE